MKDDAMDNVIGLMEQSRRLYLESEIIQQAMDLIGKLSVNHDNDSQRTSAYIEMSRQLHQFRDTAQFKAMELENQAKVISYRTPKE